MRVDSTPSFRTSAVRSPHVRPAPDEPRFSVGIALAGWLAALVFSNIGALIILAAVDYSGTDYNDLPLWLIAVLQLPLWVGLVGTVVIVSRRFGTGSLRKDYGFRFRTSDVVGLPIGVVVQLVFIPLLYRALSIFVDTSSVSDPAERLTDRAQGIGVALLVVLVVVGAPIIEELFFRGLLLRSIQARWTDTLALLASAILFGLAHFELLQLPALVLFGLVAGYCAQRTGRLGMSIWAHVGFNATTVAFLLFR
jgi:membrane protease YdiL (CAAX protease family)